MRRILLLFVFLLPLNLMAFENYYSQNDCDSCDNFCYCNWCDLKCGWDAEFRVAYFLPTSGLFRDIYRNDRVDYELEVSKILFTDFFCGDLSGWTSVDYFNATGRSRIVEDGHERRGDRTFIEIIPWNFGFKYTRNFFNCVNAYAGLGASYVWTHIRNHNEHVREHVNRNGWGFITKLGVRYDFWECAYVDLFADYLYKRVKFVGKGCNEGNRESVGGWKFGGGIGWMF